MRSKRYAIVVERAADGSYSAYVPDLPGCTSCGDTREELERNIREAILGHLAAMRDAGESAPEPVSGVGYVEVG